MTDEYFSKLTTSTTKRRLPPGIELRHARTCPAGRPRETKGACNCKPRYVAVTFDRRTGTRTKKSFAHLAEAKNWRHDRLVALDKGTLAPTSKQTVAGAAEALIEGMAAGTALNRSGERFKPSVERGYVRDLRAVVIPELGTLRLADLRRRHVQALVDQLVAEGRSGSKIRNALMPLRVLIRRALERDELAVNPMAHLRLPAPAQPRERAAGPGEVADLLAALPTELHALYATAAYSGARNGELRGLVWADVDFGANEITITRSWDEKAGPVSPKSKAGTRRVPIVPTLRRILLEHRMAAGHADPTAFVFPSPRNRHAPFTPSAVRRRAATAWKRANSEKLEKAMEVAWKAARLEPEMEEAWKAANEVRIAKDLVVLVPIQLHELRHGYVSMMHASGVPLEVIGDLVGHGSTYMTDRYRHLIVGQAQDAAAKLDLYLTTPRATPQAR